MGDRWRQAFEPSHPNVEYPLLVPLSNARCWSCLGRDQPWVPAAVGALFALASAGVLAAGVARLRSGALGLLAGTVSAGDRGVHHADAWQYADVPLAFFIVATVLLLALDDVAERSSRGLLLTAGLCAGLAAWTKNEGWLFLVAVLAVRVVVTWRRGGGRQMLRQAALLLAGAAPVVAVAVVFKFSVVAVGNDLVGGQNARDTLPRLADAWRYWLVAKAMVHHAVASGDWQVVVLPLCFLLLGRGPRRPRRALPGIVSVLGLMLAGYFLVYLHDAPRPEVAPEHVGQPAVAAPMAGRALGRVREFGGPGGAFGRVLAGVNAAIIAMALARPLSEKSERAGVVSGRGAGYSARRRNDQNCRGVTIHGFVTMVSDSGRETASPVAHA